MTCAASVDNPCRRLVGKTLNKDYALVIRILQGNIQYSWATMNNTRLCCAMVSNSQNRSAESIGNDNRCQVSVENGMLNQKCKQYSLISTAASFLACLLCCCWCCLLRCSSSCSSYLSFVQCTCPLCLLWYFNSLTTCCLDLFLCRSTECCCFDG